MWIRISVAPATLAASAAMNNLARHYRARFEDAEQLALDGHTSQALDICWDLRLRPDIGIVRRACVNLLIATLVTSDAGIYAQECIDLCQILRDQGHFSPEQLDRDLSDLETVSNKILQQQHEDPVEQMATLQLDDVKETGNSGTENLNESLKIEGYLYDGYVHQKAVAKTADDRASEVSESHSVTVAAANDTASGSFGMGTGAGNDNGNGNGNGSGSNPWLRELTAADSELGLPVVASIEEGYLPDLPAPLSWSPPQQPTDGDELMKEELPKPAPDPPVQVKREGDDSMPE